MDIKLMYAPGCSHIITVDQEKIMDAGIVKYKDEYYVFDSKKSKPAMPCFVKAEIFEVTN